MQTIILKMYNLQTHSDTREYFHQAFQNGYVTAKRLIVCCIFLIILQMFVQFIISTMQFSRIMRGVLCISIFSAFLWMSKFIKDKVKISNKELRFEWEIKYFFILLAFHMTLIAILFLGIKFTIKSAMNSLTGIYTGLLMAISVFGIIAIYKSFKLALVIHILTYGGLIYISCLHRELFQLWPVCLILSLFLLSAMNMIDDNSQEAFILSKKLSFQNSMAFSFFENSSNPIMIISGKEKPILEYHNKAWQAPPLNFKEIKYPISEFSHHTINEQCTNVNDLVYNAFHKNQPESNKLYEMSITYNDKIFDYKIDISSAILMDTKFVFVHYIDNTGPIELSKSKMQDKMLCSITHELLTPLNTLLAASSKLFELDPQIDAYTAIDINSYLLYLKIKDFICYSEHISGKLFITNEYANIGEIINRVIYLYSNDSISKNIKVNIIIDEHMPDSILCDKIKLMQIISNLLSNSIKYTPSKGTITISAALANKSYLISVADNGKGFDSLEFDDGKLAGLGLTVIRRICECMGTHLEVMSTKDKGTKFWFYLKNEIPNTLPDNCNSIVRKESNLHANCFLERSLCFIITDDIYFNRTTIKLMLNKLFKDVSQYEAVNGKECLDIVDKVYACYSNMIVFMDVNMPVMDGIATTKALIGLRSGVLKGISLHIIGVTAFTMKKEIDACLEAGMDEVINKPISIQQLKISIDANLA